MKPTKEELELCKHQHIGIIESVFNGIISNLCEFPYELDKPDFLTLIIKISAKESPSIDMKILNGQTMKPVCQRYV